MTAIINKNPGNQFNYIIENNTLYLLGNEVNRDTFQKTENLTSTKIDLVSIPGKNHPTIEVVVIPQNMTIFDMIQIINGLENKPFKDIQISCAWPSHGSRATGSLIGWDESKKYYVLPDGMTTIEYDFVN